jgi:hypothetical protein
LQREGWGIRLPPFLLTRSEDDELDDRGQQRRRAAEEAAPVEPSAQADTLGLDDAPARTGGGRFVALYPLGQTIYYNFTDQQFLAGIGRPSGSGSRTTRT